MRTTATARERRVSSLRLRWPRSHGCDAKAWRRRRTCGGGTCDGSRGFAKASPSPLAPVVRRSSSCPIDRFARTVAFPRIATQNDSGGRLRAFAPQSSEPYAATSAAAAASAAAAGVGAAAIAASSTPSPPASACARAIASTRREPAAGDRRQSSATSG